MFRTTDGVLAEEGTFWSAPDAIVVPASAKFEFDLGSLHELKAFVLQGDNNDEYVLEGSPDGVAYKTIWVAQPMFIGFGLRTRSVVLPKPEQARFIRIVGRGGDGFFSVSEVQAFCKVPAVFPPHLRVPPKKYGWDAIDNDVMVNVKGTTALIAALILIAACFRRMRDNRLLDFRIERFRLQESQVARKGLRIFLNVLLSGLWALLVVVLALLRPLILIAPPIIAGGCYWLGRMIDKNHGPAAVLKWATVHGSMPGFYYTAAIAAFMTLTVIALCFRKGGPRLVDTSLALIGLFSFFSWWNIGHYHFDHYIHIWEHYHYVIGAKYGPELRYGRLYQCTAVADVMDGLSARVKTRKMRRIESDNELGTSAEIMAHPEICTSAFKDPKRWDQFRSDIRFFRGRFSTDRWDESQNDHGYNATPVWAIVGRLIVDRVELTWDNIVKLGIIDSVFLVVMWLVVLWAFGWRSAA
ncbi:MAG TPA: discoidin domain-containing protein, partial [Polyangiales bacterium]